MSQSRVSENKVSNFVFHYTNKLTYNLSSTDKISRLLFKIFGIYKFFSNKYQLVVSSSSGVLVITACEDYSFIRYVKV